MSVDEIDPTPQSLGAWSETPSRHSGAGVINLSAVNTENDIPQQIDSLVILGFDKPFRASAGDCHWHRNMPERKQMSTNHAPKKSAISPENRRRLKSLTKPQVKAVLQNFRAQCRELEAYYATMDSQANVIIHPQFWRMN